MFLSIPPIPRYPYLFLNIPSSFSLHPSLYVSFSPLLHPSLSHRDDDDDEHDGGDDDDEDDDDDTDGDEDDDDYHDGDDDDLLMMMMIC